MILLLQISVKKIYQKSLLISLILISLFVSLPASKVKAQETIVLDQEILRQTTEVGRVQKVFVIPVKRTKSALIPENKIAEEIAYYFPRNGVRGISINYVVFDDGKYFGFDKNFQLNLSKTNIQSREVGIIWIYKDKFDLENSEKQINALRELINTKIGPGSDLTNLNDIEVRNFSLLNGENSVDLIFGEAKESSTKIREKIGNSIDFTKKDTGTFELTKISENLNQPPNSIIDVNITITNTSDVNAFLGKSQAFSIKTNADSQLFVSDNWLNTRTLLYDISGYIGAKSTKVYSIKFKTPAMPGDYKAVYSAFLNDKLIKDFEIPLIVADVGQKVLQISPSYYGYLTVRSEASLTGTDIGRAPSKSNYIFTEQVNGFYKIDFNGREGWVYSKNVKVIK